MSHTNGIDSFELSLEPGLVYPLGAPLGRFGNTLTFASTDCSNFVDAGTTVAASDSASAQTACENEAAGEVLSKTRWVDMDPAYNAPGDWWQCVIDEDDDETPDVPTAIPPTDEPDTGGP